MKKARRLYEPWIEKLDSFQEIPEIFVQNYNEKPDFLYLLKIPPQNGCNGFVLGVYQDYIYILENVKNEIKEEMIYYKEIEMIKHSEILLSGQLEFTAGGKRVVIDYNTVSSEIIEELIESIRSKYITENSLAEFKILHEAKTDEFDHIFLTLLRTFKEKGNEVQYLAYQKEMPVSVYKKNTFSKLLSRFFNNKLKGGMYLSNAREIVVMEKGEPLKSQKKGSYGFSISYMPIKKIISISMEPHKSFESVSELKIDFSKKYSKFLFENNNEGKEAFLNYVESCIS